MDSKNGKFASTCREGINYKKIELLHLQNPDCVFLIDCGGRFRVKMKGLSNVVYCGVVRKQPSSLFMQEIELGRLSNLTGLLPEKPMVVMYCCDLALKNPRSFFWKWSECYVGGGKRREPMGHLSPMWAQENVYQLKAKRD